MFEIIERRRGPILVQRTRYVLYEIRHYYESPISDFVELRVFEFSESDALDSLIVQSVDYATGRQVELITRNKSYIVRMGRVLERGEDWLRVGFEGVLQGSAG